MNLTKKFLTADYDELYRISEKTAIVRSRKTGKLFVKKEIGSENAEIYSRIKGIPCIEDIIYDDDKIFVIYEYIQGVSVKEHVEKNGVVPDFYVDKYISELCEILTALHKNGIVHRDITAANVIISAEGMCYLIDFGISRIVKHDKNTDTEILGTAGYASPEQFGFRQTDARSDLYSVGVLMNYMLTGAMPNEQTVKGNFGRIIEKCTAMEPNDRYTNAQQLKDAVSKTVPKRKYIAAFILVFVLCAVLPQKLGEPTESLMDFISGYVFLLFIPVSSIMDFFGIISKFSMKFSWGLKERIGLRVVIIISCMMIYSIIFNFIQSV